MYFLAPQTLCHIELYNWVFFSYLQVDLVSLTNDSLNTEVSPSFITSFPFSLIRGHKIHIIHQIRSSTSPKIHLRSIYLYTGYTKTTSTRYDATSSSRITLDSLELPVFPNNIYLIYLPMRPRISTWWQEGSSGESSSSRTQRNLFSPMNRLLLSLGSES